jgi:maltokinase
VHADVRASIAAAGPSLWAVAGRDASTPVELIDVIRLSSGWLAIGHASGEVALAPIVHAGGITRRASPGEGVSAGLAQALRLPPAGLVARVVDEAPAIVGAERPLREDTKDLAVVDGRIVVKLFARTSGGPQPGVVVPAHLAAVGFTELPSQIGTLWWRDALVATITSFVEGATDGWEWYVHAVGSAAAGEVAWADVDRHAVAIGQLVGRMHLALATPSRILPDPVGWADGTRVASWRGAAETALETACAVIDGPEGRRLRDVAPAARGALAGLGGLDGTPVMRVHGDLHVGQILRAPDGTLLVNDFDGNPLAPAGQRNEPQPAARDVAWMLAAIDHVGRVVARRRPGSRAEIDAWIERARTSFLASYLDALGDRHDLLDERLLAPFAVAQEAHEFLYAADVEPAWRYVPDAALPAALRRIGGA